MDGDDEIKAREDRGEPDDEYARDGRDDEGVREHGGKWRVEGPARVDPAGHERAHRKERTQRVQVPAEQVQARKGQILGADHQRDEEVAQRRGNRRNQEEPHHDHAVGGEQLVVGLGRDQIAFGAQKLQADERGGRPADKEKRRNSDRVQNGDAFVVAGREPRAQAVTGAEVTARRRGSAHSLASGGRSAVGASDLRYSIISSTSSSLTLPA